MFGCISTLQGTEGVKIWRSGIQNDDTVDGWNPAPSGMYETPKTMG